MYFRSHSCLCAILFLLLWGGAIAAEEVTEPTKPRDHQVRKMTWLGSVAEGGTFTVTNRFGDIRARFGGYEGKVEVIAMVQDFATEEPPLMLETAESKLGAEVTVGYRTT
ncbi:MAG: hypothetical protein GY906_19140, partial [bacterium]|nr:hypothetical protein [bacterium]